MKTSFKIQNLKCRGCANSIINKLSTINGINNVFVNTKNSSVTFFHKTDANIQEAKSILNKIGYPIVGEKNALTTKAKSFVSCAIGKIDKH